MAGQELLIQRVTASPVGRTSRELHSGQWLGIEKGILWAGRNSVRTRTTSGMISPALRMMTVSPRRISNS